VSLLGAAEIRRIAAELGVRPTKKLGQNFVIDPNTVERIVRAAQLGSGDIVLEVGPGLGSLTLALLPHVRAVIAVEVDPVLAERLPRTVAEHSDRAASLTVLQADALRIDALPAAPTALVANLPYNVSVPVLLHLIEVFPSIRSALVMVQQEVADRLVAPPGSRTYGAPSAKARWFGVLESAGSVARTVFWPVPNVDSGLVRFTRAAPPECASTRQQVFAVVDAAFAQRRKALRSALAGLAGSPDAAAAAVSAAGIDPMARGEQLSIDQFARIADALRA
jgi:16S rRNA (adenine1518-N6/adenine1519-N6)-dimethyltransferase